MNISKDEREKFLREAEGHAAMRDSLSRDYLENAKYIKNQLADWYIAIAAVCFAIGGIAISSGRTITVHPALFWWGSILLIGNGVFIFFVRKSELESESSGFPNLKQKIADLWTMTKVALEHADGDNSRSDEFMTASAHFVDDYDSRSAALKWWQWIKFVMYACMLDVVFGLLLFPLLMLASQLPDYPRISFKTYSLAIWSLLAIYIVYVVFQALKAIREKKATDAADRQIKAEVDKGRGNYDKARAAK